MKLNKREIEFLKSDLGYSQVIQNASGEIHAIKNGIRVFVGHDADDVRCTNPAILAATTGRAA